MPKPNTLTAACKPNTLTAAVRQRIRRLAPGVEFETADVERITRQLAPDCPATKTSGSIRCMLQRLRSEGLLFVAPGRYVWPERQEDQLAAKTAGEAAGAQAAEASLSLRRLAGVLYVRLRSHGPS